MPSWGVHLATANEILKKIDIEDRNAFLIGNFLPDAERYVVKDFSIFVPYNITHKPEIQNVDGILDKLPNYNEFIKKYMDKMNNPLVLGYLTHLITDYYWNKVTHLRYTIRDKDGNCVGLKLNNGTEIEANKIIRRKCKHNDFSLFDKSLLQLNNYEIPSYKENLITYIQDIEETKYNKNDFIKIIDYLNVKLKKQGVISNYKLYTLEQMIKDFDNSIEFIIKVLRNNNIVC